MTITNFNYLGYRDKIHLATVEVTSGCLWWKTTKRKVVFKEHKYWRWMDDGTFCPSYIVENLELTQKAEKILKEFQ